MGCKILQIFYKYVTLFRWLDSKLNRGVKKWSFAPRLKLLHSR